MEKFIFFHQTDEENGYLSNWYKSDFTIDGITFSSVEQYLMWSKARMFGDAYAQRKILKTDDPAEIKSLGRKVRGYVDGVWAANRADIAVEALTAKFSQNEELKEMLLKTKGSVIAECAVRDTIWGIGYSMHDPKRFDRSSWRGKNLLGYSLMAVRDSLE